MADSQGPKENTWQDLVIEFGIKSKISLFIEQGVENISDLTFINLEEMKEMHKFTRVQLFRLHRLQTKCALNLGTDPPPAPLVPGSAIKGDSKIPKYKIQNLDERSNYKGLGIILVIEKFSDGKVRQGASCDSLIFHNLFTKMGLNIASIPNATQSDFLYRIRFEVQQNLELPTIFIAISSHGSGSDKIVCADNKTIKVSEIIAMLQIPKLMGKPKVLLIEACRGNSRDVVETDSAPDNFPEYQAATKESDILVAYSCVSGYVAYRDTSAGSWFVNAIIEAYEAVSNEDFVSILTFANGLMLNRNFHHGKQITKQPMNIDSTLTKLLII